MSLFKRGNVYWSRIVRDGVVHRFSTGATVRKEAQKIEDKKKQELNEARFQIVEFDPDITVGEIAAKFAASGSAHKSHLYHLQFVLGFFSDTAARRITKALAEEYRLKRKQYNPKIKDATINRDLSVLRRVLYWALDELLIPANPLARLKMPPERRIRRQILSIAEENALLAAAKPHLRTMIVIALDTGMRRGEITSQRWEDIDFAQKIISVSHSKTVRETAREIPLTERLFALLWEHRKSSGFVIQFDYQPVRIIKTAWRTALKNAAVRHVRFHDLRHTFATRCMEAGVLQEVRMEIMGHSQGAKIHSTYVHIELPTKREAIRKLEAWVSDQQRKLKEQSDADSEERNETASRKAGAETLEEKDARRSGPRTGRQAESGDHGNGERTRGEATPIAEIRRSKKALRVPVTREGER